MSTLATLLLALSLATDAFAAALAKGASRQVAPGPVAALRVGATFGTLEALAPLAGWAVGLAFAAPLAAIDHWLAFALLAAVGGRMILTALAAGPDAPTRAPAAAASGRTLLLAAAGTSIDAAAVGMSLALIEADILGTVLVIGAVTAGLATLGVLMGRAVGPRFGRAAGAFGGVALIAIGLKILAEHTLFA